MAEPSAEYTAGLKDAYLGERAAERVYRALAERAADPVERDKFAAIADIERMTATVLAPAARRLGIAVTEADLEQRAAGRVEELGRLSFDAFIRQAAERWPPYIAEFERLANLAPREDAEAMQLLVAHERALVRFVEIEQAGPGGRQSLQPLTSLLALMPRAGRAPLP